MILSWYDIPNVIFVKQNNKISLSKLEIVVKITVSNGLNNILAIIIKTVHGTNVKILRVAIKRNNSILYWW
jgi:hypothetical protein